MMADEYIRRDDAFDVLTECYHHKLGVQHEALREALSRVPSAAVQPVVRGRWIKKNAGNATCSNCNCRHRDVYDDDAEDAFCRSCGADMLGDETEIS